MKTNQYSLVRIISFALFALFTGSAFATSGFSTELESSLKKAKKAKKPTMVLFTGSDWCRPCQVMHKKVFSKKDFISKASKKFQLVELDMPNKDPELKKKNIKLMSKYRVTGVPSIVLFDKNGKVFTTFAAGEFTSVKKFLAKLDLELEKKDMD